MLIKKVSWKIFRQSWNKNAPKRKKAKLFKMMMIVKVKIVRIMKKYCLMTLMEVLTRKFQRILELLKNNQTNIKGL